jgi:hypothetical protein
VAVITDVRRNGKPVVGYGFNSNGRYGQGCLICERFAPRILEADPKTLIDEKHNNLDPAKVWTGMMRNEKPGGHGSLIMALSASPLAPLDRWRKQACHAELGSEIGVWSSTLRILFAIAMA